MQNTEFQVPILELKSLHSQCTLKTIYPSREVIPDLWIVCHDIQSVPTDVEPHSGSWSIRGLRRAQELFSWVLHLSFPLKKLKPIRTSKYIRRKFILENTGHSVSPDQMLAVDTPTLCKLLCCGRQTAVQIGDLAHARITMNSRVLWSVQRIREYLYDISC